MSEPSRVERLTAQGAGGVAVLRVAGRGALERLRHLAGGALPRPGEVRLALLRDPGEGAGAPPLDEALLVGRGGAVEVHTHGSPAIVRAVSAALGGASTGPELPRSLEERAEAAAATAPTVAAARILIDQAEGALRRELEAILAGPEDARRPRLLELAEVGARCARLWTPTTVALVGPVNAGKSTLFNVLLGEDVAAVTPIPGTTRDALGAAAELEGWPVLLVDTAGERDLRAELGAGDRHAAVEVAGQQLAREAALRAGLVLEVVPAAAASGVHPATDRGGEPPRVLVRSRAAEVLGADPEGWGPAGISALEAPGHARQRVAALFRDALGLGALPDWVPGRAVPFEGTLIQRMVDLATTERVERSALASLLAPL